MLTTTIAGLATGLTLIIAIGAQNAFVLRQGIRREHVVVVVAICAMADIALITLGTVGVGALILDHPPLLTAMKWIGCAYLTWFGLKSFWSARRPGSLREGDAPTSRGSVVTTTLALTFLNPHVYLDTVVMLGNIANQYGDLRWWFVLGSALASTVWFTALGTGGRSLAAVLARPRTWQVVDVLVGLLMLGLAVKLATL